MNTATQRNVILTSIIALVAALLLTDRVVPDELWAAVALLVGVLVPRPGDTTPRELARVLEENDPTQNA